MNNLGIGEYETRNYRHSEKLRMYAHTRVYIRNCMKCNKCT